jgi:hypothetical protein
MSKKSLLPKTLPLDELLESLPRRVNRKTGAKLIEHHYFPISHRTLENWPVPWTTVNGQATAETAELFKVAQEKLDAAPTIRGGCRPIESTASGKVEV